MKRIPIERLLARENLFAALYLFFFAAILIHSDPAWLMWAGPISLGAFPAEIAPPVLISPLDAFRAAAGGAFLGLLALALLFSANGVPRTRA